jgi:hypothetical protein
VAATPNVGTISCPRCGNQVAAGRRFCNKCGAAMSAVPTSIQPTPTPASAAKPARQPGLSILWLLIPTGIFVVLRLIASQQSNLAESVVVVAAAAGLFWWKQQPLPADVSPTIRRLKPFTYALQIGIVFVLLGGAIAGVALAGVAAFVVFVAQNPKRVVDALEPWWGFQEKFKPPTRRLLAFVVPGVIGWYLGTQASGIEWGMTLVSLSIGASVGFLFIFTPPASMRKGRT